MAAGQNVQRIKPREPLVPLKSLAWLVRIPGNPTAVRAFTDTELDDAHRYATEQGGTCEPLH